MLFDWEIRLFAYNSGSCLFDTATYYKAHKEKKLKARYNNSGIDKIDRMSGEQFEYWLKCRFEKQGYKASTTPKTKDFGADLILRKKGGETIIVQAKRYRGRIGIKAVQEVIGALSYYHCQKGLVITNSYFTSSAKKLAYESSVELWDRETIIDQLVADKKQHT